MRSTARRGIIVLIALVVWGGAVPAEATDNLCWPTANQIYCNVRWPLPTSSFLVNSTTLTSAQRTAIRSGASDWNAYTSFHPSYGGTTTNSLPSTGDHIVWKGGIPVAWQQVCTPALSLACTRITFNGDPPPYFILDADMVFNGPNYGVNFSTDDLNCQTNPPGYFDVWSVAEHEFGHFGGLNHVAFDVLAVMWGSYTICKRHVAPHDIQSMIALYF